MEGGDIATSTGEKHRSLSDTYNFLLSVGLSKVSVIVLGNLNLRHIFQSLTPLETAPVRVLVTRRHV